LTFICVISRAATFKSAIQNSSTWADAEGRLLPSQGLALDANVFQLFAAAEEARGNLRFSGSVLDILVFIPSKAFCLLPH